MGAPPAPARSSAMPTCARPSSGPRPPEIRRTDPHGRRAAKLGGGEKRIGGAGDDTQPRRLENGIARFRGFPRGLADGPRVLREGDFPALQGGEGVRGRRRDPAPSGPRRWWRGRRPGTSEMHKVSERAGCRTAASRPPLMRDRCLRTRLMSEIGAPDASSAFVSACLSTMSSPRAGATQLAEPPPDTRTRARSSGPACAASASTSAVALQAAASGTGCPASTQRIERGDGHSRAASRRCRSDAQARCRPARRYCCSQTSAIWAPDLPQASTIRRPCGRGR
jgi:hypothetical protein